MMKIEAAIKRLKEGKKVQINECKRVYCLRNYKTVGRDTEVWCKNLVGQWFKLGTIKDLRECECNQEFELEGK